MGKTLCCVLAGLIIVLSVLSTRVQAGEGGPERSLQTTARALRELSGRLQLALVEGRDTSADIALLKGLGESLQSTDLLLRERLRVRGDALQQSNGEGALRHQLTVERYQSTVTRLHAAIAKVTATVIPDQALLDEFSQAIDEMVPLRKDVLHGLLPYQQPEFPPQTPAISPKIVPAYRMVEIQPATLADLSGTPESPVSSIIAQQAQLIAAEAGHDHWGPAVIYNWVRKNIRTEWYWGSMKGAEETLRQGSGNDADQATLLIALLRSAGYPARFVRGTIEFFPGLDAALAAAGIEDPERLPAFFQAAGIPCEAIRDGGVVSNVHIEHIWVEVLIPYTNYRGLVDDPSGKIWLPLDTSIKTGATDIASAIDLFSLPGNPIPGFRDRYLAADRLQSPLVALAMETEQFLSASFPAGTMFAETLHTWQQRPQSIVIVPGSLQFVDVAVTAEYAALPVELQHQARLRAESVNSPGALLFDLTLPVRDLSNRRIIVGFEPETVADQELINLWGGLANTPAYLVRLRPTLVVDGKRMVIAADGLASGEDFILTVDFTAPAGSVSIKNTLQSGYPHLLGLVAQEALPPSKFEVPDAATDLLHRAALVYIDEWNRGERTFANLLNLSLVRPMPSLVMVGGILGVDVLAGEPHAVEWQGLYLDADFRCASVIQRNGIDDERIRRFFELSSLEGSVQEHRIFEQEFGVVGMSTARLLGLAQQASIPLLTFDSINLPSMLAGLEFFPSVTEDIASAVAGGLVVKIPETVINYEAWGGIGYLKEDPRTGEAGYMLSGGLAGGQTVLGRNDWPEEIAVVMGQPFTGEPNDDPTQAFSIAAVTPPDARLATAGEALAESLMVQVRDARGVAVVGAAVTFSVRSGGGWLTDEVQQPGVRLLQLTALSGRDGVARVGFVPGEKTSINPVVYVRDGDLHANLVGQNLIDARLDIGSMVALSQPIAILGFAGLPDPVLSKAYGNNLRGEAHGYSGDTLMLLKDRFGNPIANHSVTFNAGVVEPAAVSSCQNPPNLPLDRRNAQLVADENCLSFAPVYGECSSLPTVSVVSRSDGGAKAGVILGGVPYARYPINAMFVANSGDGHASWTHFSEAFASCLTTPSAPESRLVLRYQERQNEAGRNVDARPAGEAAEILLKAYLLAENETVLPKGQALSCTLLPVQNCDTIVGNGLFKLDYPETVSIDGNPARRATAMTGSQALPYLYRGEISLPIGLSEVPVAATAILQRQQINNSCERCGSQETVEMVVGPEHRTVAIWGVDIQVPTAVTVLIDSRGISQHNLSFNYVIAPADYAANYAQVALYRNGELWATFPSGTSGNASAAFPSGYWFDPRATYELQVLLNNPGDANEVRSRKVPVLQRTAAVDLVVDGLPVISEKQVGAFVLLNNDFDEKDADPLETLPDAATPSMIETDDELKRAWLQIDDSTGQVGSWQVRASDPAKLRIFHHKDGAWVEFKPTDPPVPVTDYPAVIPLYLEGLVESAAIRGDTLTTSFFPSGGGEVNDVVPVTVMELDMAVDGDRDRKIDFRNSHDEQALFWVNNDFDVRKWDAGDWRSVEDDSQGGDDRRDSIISCKRDLEDFARLHIRLGNVAVPPSLVYTLHIRADDEQVQPMLNVFPAVNLSDGYLGLPSEQATVDQPEKQLLTRLLAAVSETSITLASERLEKNKVNSFLFEGRMPGKGRLVLTANYQGVPVATREVNLTLVDMRYFYDHFVLSLNGTGDMDPVKADVNPEGMEANASHRALYRPVSDEYVMFVHGWNMQEWEKRRWAETIFKRLWWQGYQGKLGLFDWPCETFSLLPGVTNFDRSEARAWQSAAALRNILSSLQEEHADNIRLLAHSQGNVVAGEAIRLGAPGLVHSYVASQAALSANFFHQNTSEIRPTLEIELETPEVMGSYPAGSPRAPYFDGIGQKAASLVSYYNVRDYALTTGGELTFAWEYNNRTKPDESRGYRYLGDFSSYPEQLLPQQGFVQGHRDLSLVYVVDRELRFPVNRYEIFAYAAESRSKAIGAVHLLPAFAELSATTDTPGSRDLEAFAGFNEEHYSHSRQFRSNIIDEQRYWQAFIMDAGLKRSWPEEGGN